MSLEDCVPGVGQIRGPACLAAFVRVASDTVVLVVGLDTTGRTADVVPLTAAGRSGNAATLYEREAGATTSFERVDKLVPIQGAERDDSKDAWVVLQANIEAAKARYLSPSGQAAARAEMEQLEANIDPRIFEREPQAPASLQQLWIGSGLAAGAALACLVMQSQATMKSAESATNVLNGIAAFLGIVAVGLALAALRNQSGES
ncbi:hypothetical protein F1559_003069 [Cyanidiococcus yangmingshanensis]|uniref:Uncharacterized protein n=1 Tax=Cyanidiococcus yangmingshanensis TaxID=2690220 RepID=A0A7J7IFX4_9RHOD|nr:hypothetical protein F1559_003069 [Cyanidiococcus yangmingshanensis]